MQNFIRKFRQSAIDFEKPGFFGLKNWKLEKKMKIWQLPTAIELIYFRTRFLLTNVYKRVSGLFIVFRSWVTCKNKKDLVSTQSFFTFLLKLEIKTKQRNFVYHFVDIIKKETCAKFQQKLLNWG